MRALLLFMFAAGAGGTPFPPAPDLPALLRLAEQDRQTFAPRFAHKAGVTAPAFRPAASLSFPALPGASPPPRFERVTPVFVRAFDLSSLEPAVGIVSDFPALPGASPPPRFERVTPVFVRAFDLSSLEPAVGIVSDFPALPGASPPPRFERVSPASVAAPSLLASLSQTPRRSIEVFRRSGLVLDPFELKLQFVWREPHGQFMKDLLSRARTARDNGDMALYRQLQTQYEGWAATHLDLHVELQLDNLREKPKPQHDD
jgi:hypothetical protein